MELIDSSDNEIFLSPTKEMGINRMLNTGWRMELFVHTMHFLEMIKSALKSRSASIKICNRAMKQKREEKKKRL